MPSSGMYPRAMRNSRMARFCFFSAPKSTSVRTRFVSWNRCRLLRALQAIGDRAQDPQTDALGFRVADKIERLVDEFAD